MQVREIVAYAAERFIDVVPEIELPGHCGAALASFPHLGCTGETLNAMPNSAIAVSPHMLQLKPLSWRCTFHCDGYFCF